MAKKNIHLMGDVSKHALPSEIWRWSATDLAHQIKQKAVSCSEVLEAFFKRIDQVNPHLNAIVYSDREQASVAARAADALLSRSPQEAGALHGVPITVKLNADVRGEATSNGVPAYAQKIAPEDSVVVENMRRAGGIIVGRTNVPPFSYRWFTENPLHGRTLNPWSDAITSGGSSGGAAVAVASGMCALSHGTDIAGSIRYPAFVNGQIGLRPTPGRVPALNATVPARLEGLQMFSSQGPIARNVRDAALGLRVMATSGFRDPLWVNVPLYYPDDNEPVRVAFCDQIPGAHVAPEILAGLDQAAHALRDAGYIVERVCPPRIEETLAVWLEIVITEVRLGMLEEVEATNDSSIQSSVTAMAACAPPSDLRTYVTALGRRDALRREWNAFFLRYPLLLMPTSCRTPMEWGEDLKGTESMRQLLKDQSPLFAIAAMSLPAMNIPTGVSNGLPIGVQLVSAAFREQRLIAAGQIIENDADMMQVFDR